MTAHNIDESERDGAGIMYLTRNAAALFGDLRVALRSLGRTPALWVTVALTLALGIGADTAIFSVVRSVLLRPLVNRDEDRLIYIQQKAPGLQVENATFSIPEITDIGADLKTIGKLGTFSTVDFTGIAKTTHTKLHTHRCVFIRILIRRFDLSTIIKSAAPRCYRQHQSKTGGHIGPPVIP